MNGWASQRIAGLAIIVGIGLASSALGGTPEVEFGIGAQTYNGPVLAGVYTDPYAGYFNNDLALGEGTSSTASLWTTGNEVAAFCDDFNNEVNPPQYWNAYDTSLTSLTSSSPVYYDGTSGSSYAGIGNIYDTATGTGGPGAALPAQFSQTADYIAVSYLAYESLTDKSTSDDELYSYALWDIFDGSLLGSTSLPYGNINGSQLSQAQGYVATALGVGEYFASNGGAQAFENYYTGISSVQIYTPVSGAPGSYGPQEFVVVNLGSQQGAQVPEPSSLASLGLDLAGAAFIGLLAFCWRRAARAQS